MVVFVWGGYSATGGTVFVGGIISTKVIIDFLINIHILFIHEIIEDSGVEIG